MATEQRPTLTVYSRDHCHLCEEMISGLRRLQARFHFELAIVDVDSDPELQRRHGEKVPVLMHGERELCHAALEPVSVTAYLENFR